MGAVVAFPPRQAPLAVTDTSVHAHTNNVRRLTPREAAPQPAEPMNAERLMLLAMFFALSPEARETARAFLIVADPNRSDPATALVENLMRRIRQLG